MVYVQVRVAERMNELARLQTSHLGHHHREQCVGGNVEGNSQEDIGAPLIQLARQATVQHIELKQHVTGGQGHPGQFPHVPRADHQPPRIGVRANPLNQVAHLVDRTAVGRRPAAPLPPIHGPQLAPFVRPLVPDRHAVFPQVSHVRVASQKPQQLVDDGLEVQFLRRDDREPLPQIEPHLVSKDTECAGPGPVPAGRAGVENPLHQVQVLSHWLSVSLM